MKYTEFGYEYDAEINQELFEETRGKATDAMFQGAYCLRSGRDALKVIAREYDNATVLIPALACDSMINPFEGYNHKVLFYRYTKSLEIDREYLFQLLEENKSDIILFLYMNYFGIESVTTNELVELKNKYSNLVCINDITHTYLYPSKKEFEPDYTLVSLRKWVNIPDGGLLWVKNNLNNKYFAEDNSFSETRLKAQDLKYHYHLLLDESYKSEYRKIFPHVTDEIDESPVPCKMSEYSYRVLLNTDFNSIRNAREQNSRELIDLLKNCSNINLIQPSDKRSNLYVPFTISNRDEKQKKLSSLGIFNTIIWPIRAKQKEVCLNSKYIEEHMLAAPCDQRYCVSDMEYIGKEIVRIINE